jgi:glycosyltransferase involved in cell wall biosynthesis
MTMSLSTPVPVSVVVLTFNEGRNLTACLESVAGWATEIFVVDSGSTDRTVEIAGRFGAQVVAHSFDTHARQWAWALGALPIRTPWVLGLDADQRVTAELRREVTAALAGASQPDGYFVRRRQIFRGRWIRHGGYYPKYLLKLFRVGRVSIDERELVDHHFHVDGPVRRLHADIIEDNQNEAAIAEWTAKHNRYAVLQARQELNAVVAGAPAGVAAMVRSPDERTRGLKRIWARLPLFVRPCAYVLYRYVFRLGFLDGKEGFEFHVLQAFWYRLLVDINIDEQRAARLDAGESPVAVPRSPAPESAATRKTAGTSA